jgi:hypothetical protein
MYKTHTNTISISKADIWGRRTITKTFANTN